MSLQRALLEARDARQMALERTLAEARARSAGSVVVVSANIPGPEKILPGLARLLRGASGSLGDRLGAVVRHATQDGLGPFLLLASDAPPSVAKAAALALESESPAGRLLDLDVFAPDGSQLDRRALGLAPRSCLLCAEPAGVCIRLGRHGTEELRNHVDTLLRPFAPVPQTLDPERLTEALVAGALEELELTPKPGLVDRRDSGSHPDLSLEKMRLSIGLLPRFYEALRRGHRERWPLEAFVAAGREAEARMHREIGANAHRGYIFLSGLLLLAALEGEGDPSQLRPALAQLAGRFFSNFDPADSHGAEARRRHGLGGIRAEALEGLPALFTKGWPRYREALEMGWDPDRAGFYLMGLLMQSLEDTTAVQRCGPEGLARLRRDGAKLQQTLEAGRAPEPLLTALNDDYRRIRLTMGGVADCLALAFALRAGGFEPSI